MKKEIKIFTNFRILSDRKHPMYNVSTGALICFYTHIYGPILFCDQEDVEHYIKKLNKKGFNFTLEMISENNLWRTHRLNCDKETYLLCMLSCDSDGIIIVKL